MNLRRYAIGALFALIAIGLLRCCTPDISWACLNVDLFDFMYSTSELNVPHPPGLPLYTMLGYLCTLLPGNDAWGLALGLSVIPTLITCGLIFHIVSVNAKNEFAPFVALVAFAGSQIVFSQAIIPEIYALETMFVILTYYLLERGHHRWAMLSLGCAMSISWGAVILLPLFVWRYRRQLWVRGASWCLLPLLTYLFLPIANRPPHMSLGGTGLSAYWQYYTQHSMALLNLPAWEFPERLGIGIVVLLACMGLACVIGLLGAIKSEHRTLLWLCLPGALFFLTTQGEDAVVQLIPVVAFLSIAAGLYLRKEALLVPMAVLVISGGLLAVNMRTYDIGVELDPYPTRARQFVSQLEVAGDDDVVVCWTAATYAGVYWYNETYDRSLRPIHPVFISPEKTMPWELDRFGLVYDWGQGELEPPGNIGDYGDWIAAHDAWAQEVTTEFATHNPGVQVWTMISHPDRRQIGVLVIPAGAAADTEPVAIAEPSVKDALLLYPYTYKMITGQYAMSYSWHVKTDTNMTVGIFALLLAFGAVLGYFVPRKIFKRLSPTWRTVATGILTALMALGFCFVLSLAGVPGFRW